MDKGERCAQQFVGLVAEYWEIIASPRKISPRRIPCITETVDWYRLKGATHFTVPVYEYYSQRICNIILKQAQLFCACEDDSTVYPEEQGDRENGETQPCEYSRQRRVATVLLMQLAQLEPYASLAKPTPLGPRDRYSY
ncbi:hypothetical protein PM082_017652 [Marasmius tenuissimus]|nr:hypothetical protein PM082_017652 [Marasmius tenuissimus]